MSPSSNVQYMFVTKGTVPTSIHSHIFGFNKVRGRVKNVFKGKKKLNEEVKMITPKLKG